MLPWFNRILKVVLACEEQSSLWVPLMQFKRGKAKQVRLK